MLPVTQRECTSTHHCDPPTSLRSTLEFSVRSRVLVILTVPVQQCSDIRMHMFSALTTTADPTAAPRIPHAATATWHTLPVSVVPKLAEHSLGIGQEARHSASHRKHS